MLVIKVELWPVGLELEADELYRIFVANDDTGTPDMGNYAVAIMRKRERRPPWKHGRGGQITAKPARTGRVEGYTEDKNHTLLLVTKAIRALFPEWEEWDKPTQTKGTWGRVFSWRRKGDRC